MNTSFVAIVSIVLLILLGLAPDMGYVSILIASGVLGLNILSDIWTEQE